MFGRAVGVIEEAADCFLDLPTALVTPFFTFLIQVRSEWSIGGLLDDSDRNGDPLPEYAEVTPFFYLPHTGAGHHTHTHTRWRTPTDGSGHLIFYLPHIGAGRVVRDLLHPVHTLPPDIRHHVRNVGLRRRCEQHLTPPSPHGFQGGLAAVTRAHDCVRKVNVVAELRIMLAFRTESDGHLCVCALFSVCIVRTLRAHCSVFALCGGHCSVCLRHTTHCTLRTVRGRRTVRHTDRCTCRTAARILNLEATNPCLSELRIMLAFNGCGVLWALYTFSSTQYTTVAYPSARVLPFCCTLPLP